MLMLKRAALTNIRFQVLVTESRPSSHGAKAVKELKEAGIPATLILDAAVGYFMGKVNMVLVGAEGIAEVNNCDEDVPACSKKTISPPSLSLPT